VNPACACTDVSGPPAPPWPKARLRALCGPWAPEDQRSGRCAGACGPTDREAPWPVWPPWDQRRARSLALGHDLDLSGEGDPESNLASSAVSGQSPPAGPQWSSGLRPLKLHALAYDKPLCASLDGFTLHAATRAGGLDAEGREALLRYVLRGPRPGCALRRSHKSEWSSNPTASWPEARLRAAHHPEKSLRRWDGSG